MLEVDELRYPGIAIQIAHSHELYDGLYVCCIHLLVSHFDHKLVFADWLIDLARTASFPDTFAADVFIDVFISPFV